MKKLCLFLAGFVLSGLLFFGCASTEVEGVSKNGVNLTEINDILIFCNFENIKYRKQLEKEFQTQFAKAGIKSHCSIDIFPPLKEYSDAELNEGYETNNIKNLMEVKILSMSSNQKNDGTVFFPVGGILIGGTDSSTKLNMDFGITLYDTGTKEILLKATASSEDENDDLSDCLEQIFPSVAQELVSKYFKKQN